MSNLSDIKRRLASIKQTRQITGAMQTVSIVKMRKATELYESSRAYINMLKEITESLPGCDGADSALFSPPNSGAPLYFVITSDKGLCGGFDNEIFKTASAALPENAVVMPIGRAGAEKFKNFPNVDTRFVGAYSVDRATSDAIRDYVLDGYGSAFDSVYVVYSRFTGKSGAPTVTRLLPIEQGGAHKPLYTDKPVEQVYGRLLPLYLSGMLYGALLNNHTSEQYARHAAMSAATDSADSAIAALSVEYNRARQNTVTSQITEIIGATSALGSKGVRNEEGA